ncbi:MAG: divalent anion:Na+ symporter, family [Desulfovibrionales bacterium]|nr:divalent anion:Na+ symporter, family [Desulfovibrionales bacterium]
MHSIKAIFMDCVQTRPGRISVAISILAIVAGVWIAYLPPPDGLAPTAMRAFGVITWAVGWWISQIVPEYVTAMMMCTLLVGVKAVDFNTAFANFSSSGWWIMVGAFGLGAVAARTGLLRRISLWVLRLFPPTFTGQVLGLISSGTIIGLLVPSMNAKAAMSSPIALAISDSLGVRRKSDAAAGLFGACYTGFVLMGHIFLSGSFSHYALIATLPKQYQHVTWMDWFVWSLPWGVFTAVTMTAAILILYRPKEAISLPEGYGRRQLEQLGPITREEKAVLIVLVGALGMWMTESLHHIPSGVVAISAMCVLLGMGVMTRDDFKSGIEWPAIMLIGCMLNSRIINSLGLDAYLVANLKPFLSTLLSSPALFIVAVAVSLYVVKFAITNQTATAVIYCLILAPALPSFGMHPWIIAFVSFCAGGIWIMAYTNTIYLCAQFGTHRLMVTDRSMLKLNTVYMFIIIAGCLICIPYWKYLGLIQ